MARTILYRLHNPRNRTCGCDSDCWCQQTTAGRALRWWLPIGPLGPRHRSRATAEWKRQRAETS